MNSVQLKPVLLMTLLATMFVGCQRHDLPKKDQEAAASAPVVAETPSVPLLQVKAVNVANYQKNVCEKEGCTQFVLQTVESGVPWIDDYFNDRIRKAEPIAFAEHAPQKVDVSEGSQAGLNQQNMSVRYIGQQYNLATFAIYSYSYSAGAAHGMYHIEYVNFDLKTHKRLSLQDILKKGAEQKVLDSLYDANINWLYNHKIEKAQLKLSDNFYYGPNGLMFVYPLYELASYAEGMSELELPYESAGEVIQAQYLPSLPKYNNQ